jgi:hypothetical protein
MSDEPQKTYRLFFAGSQRLSGYYDIEATDKDEAEDGADWAEVEMNAGWREHMMDADDTQFLACRELDAAGKVILEGNDDRFNSEWPHGLHFPVRRLKS